MKSLKLVGLLLMVLVGMWTALIIPSKSPFNTSLNVVISCLGMGLILLVSALEERGEI